MLPNGTISADRIWKRFRPDKRAAGRPLIRDQLRFRSRRERLDWQWALRDVSITAPPGGSVGLVGNNGSGKSTLLKILTRVMYPYAGRVHVSGRVGALIEVRAGIHPDLTGRENMFLYGTLLGLKRSVVAARFDEIVAFAQLEHAIDRQVKFYSSGMQMRLGFGVAAFLEPDILLVDEVLAVGDAAFQQRCLERMRTVLNGGTTLVYVSHDLASVAAICSRVIWLTEGISAHEGPAQETLALYRRAIEAETELTERRDGLVRLAEIEAFNPEGSSPGTQQPLELRMVFESAEARQAGVFLGISEGTADPIFVVRREVPLASGTTEVHCSLPRLPLSRGRFFAWISVDQNGQELLAWHPATHFDVDGADLDEPPKAVVRRSPIHVDVAWDVATTNGQAGVPTRSVGTEPVR